MVKKEDLNFLFNIKFSEENPRGGEKNGSKDQIKKNGTEIGSFL